MAKATNRDIAEAVLELSGKYSGKKLSRAVATYLTHEHRTADLDAVMRQVASLRQQKHGVSEVTITSARPVDGKVKKRLLDMIEGKKIVNEVIDKSVLGGMRLESDELLLDLTVRNRINTLKQGVKN